MTFLHRHRGLTPYLLLAPGMLWLAAFFVVPLGFLAYQSLQSGNLDVGYAFTWSWGNYWNAVHDYHAEFIRSAEYAGIATVLALLVSYPVAYWIAFRGGRWKNLFLLGIVAPFFVTYLIRTLAWETILADDGVVTRTLKHVGILGTDGRLLAKGDIWACFAWSGDMVQLQADHPGLKWNQPDSGAMIWTDNMLIPKGGNVYTASTYMNYYYTPKVAAEVGDYVNYICPVQGADAVLKKSDPAVAKNPLIFPTKKMLGNVHQIDAKAVNNQDYKKAFQALLQA